MLGLELSVLSEELVELAHFRCELLPQSFFRKRVSNDVEKRVVVPRFFQIVVEADFIDRLYGVLFIRIAGQEEPNGCGLQQLDFF